MNFRAGFVAALLLVATGAEAQEQVKLTARIILEGRLATGFAGLGRLVRRPKKATT